MLKGRSLYYKRNGTFSIANRGSGIVKKWAVVMECCIILHDMMVETRMLREDANSGEHVETKNAVVGKDAAPLYALKKLHDTSASTPPAGSIAALSAASK
eukprot:IDg4274t1